MGVLGLWQILESVGHPIKLEGLEGKRMGVDANVWLYKFIRGFRDKDNAATIDSHKLGLFNRICKLLFYKIKPVFVFDGPAPALKRRTLERRQNMRSKHLMKVQGAAMKILAEQLKKQYPDAKIDDLTIQVPQFNSNGLVAAEKLTDEDASLFYLPPEQPKKDDEQSSNESSDGMELVDFATSSKWRRKEESKIDVESKEFKTMPPEVRYEILQDIKEDRKRIRNSGTLPDDAESFSNFQLSRLKARRSIQEKIEECEKDICSIYTGECDGRSISSYRMQSDPTSRMIYIQNHGGSQGSQVLSATSSSSQAEQLKEQYPDAKIDDLTIQVPQFNPNRLIPAEKSTEDASVLYLSPVQPKKDDEQSSDESSDGLELVDFTSSSNWRKKESTIYVESEEFETISREKPNLRYEILQDLGEDGKRIRDSGGMSDDTELLSNSRSSSPMDRRPIQERVEECEKADERSSDESSDGVELVEITTSSKGREAPSESNIDVESKEFETMPPEKPEVRCEILQDLKEDKKLTPDSGTLHDGTILLSDSQSSSPKARRTIQEKIGDCDKDDEQSSDESTDGVELIDFKTMPPECDNDICSISNDESGRRSIASDCMQSDSTSRMNPIQNHGEPEGSQVLSAASSSSQYPSVTTNLATLINHDSATSNRMANKVTTKIVEESKELLRLFGIPYVDAAGEAEAQCALLEELKLTEGTITDDSDIWLFGAKNVYRYFFSDDKYVMQYKLNDIEYHLRLTRQELVCFAMLVGSDYTDGIMNVGPVNALEIISEFPGDGMTPLIRFKEWRDKHTKKSEVKVKHRKFLKFQLPEGFPSRTVFEGYMRPVADTSTEQFSWGIPDLDELREYARRNFGWDSRKIDEKLLPVMKKLSERKTQPTIDSFFFKTAANQNPELFRSKRVNQALSKLAKQNDVVMLSEDDEDDHNESEQEDSDVVEAKKNKNKKAIRGRGASKNTTNHKTKARAAGKSRPKSESAIKPKRQRRSNKDA